MICSGFAVYLERSVHDVNHLVTTRFSDFVCFFRPLKGRSGRWSVKGKPAPSVPNFYDGAAAAWKRPFTPMPSQGNGFIGYGIVTATKTRATEFITDDGLLVEQRLKAPGLAHHAGNASTAEYVVGIDWQKTVEPTQAKWFKGAFAN